MVKLIGYKNLLSFKVTKRENLGKQVVGWGLGRDKDLFQLPLSCEEGVYLIFMIEKHILIFRTLQSNPGVAATQPSPKRGKKRIKINSYQYLLG